MYGFLNINKPAGITSHDVVARIRRLAGRGVKVGHAGTLDPAATGVLPVALGPATRLIEYLANARKGYHTVVRLGTTTTTDDAEGEVVEQREVPPLDAATLEAALAPLRGTIMQVPPDYSALRHQGQRLYKLARQGQQVTPSARPVTVERLDLLEYHHLPGAETAPAAALVRLAIECSKGTYIRALARDLGAALGCGAHLEMLERTFVGAFALDTAIALDQLSTTAQEHSASVALEQVLLPPEVAVQAWPKVTLNDQQRQRIRNGRTIHLPQLHHEGNAASAWVRAHAPDGTLLALLHTDEEQSTWHPAKVLMQV